MVLARPAFRTLISVTLGAAILLLNALPLAVHSQSPEDGSPATTTFEGTETATPVAPSNDLDRDWFRVERLSGNAINTGDFVIGPGVIELELEPGQTVTREVSVSNRIDDDRRFKLEVEDIAGTDDGRDALVLLGDDIGPYSVKEFLSFPNDTFRLDLGERAQIPVTISIPPDAEPGGYYGSVLVSTVRADGRPDVATGANTRQPIIARVGSLFFITVPGEIEIEGQLQDLVTTDNKLWYESSPVNFGIIFENTGSKHLNPYGEMRITNMFGEEVGFVEIEPWFALPQSVRIRELSWDRELLIGRYTATVSINRGYEDIIDEAKVTFWVLPWKIVGMIFLALFVIFFLIRAFFRTFEFKRK